MIDSEKKWTYNNQWTFYNQYNNTDEELFSDYQRPRDHEWFKINRRWWISSKDSSNWWNWLWTKVRTMQVKLTWWSVSANWDYNRIPNWTMTISWDGGFCELNGKNIKFLEAWIYLFSYKEYAMETSAGNEWRHTAMLVYWANYAQTWEMFDYAIIYNTWANIIIWRASPMSTTWYATIEEWEEIVYCFTTAKRYAWSAASAYVEQLNAVIDIIKIW